MWDAVAVGKPGLSLRPMCSLCLNTTNNFDMHVMSKAAGLRRGGCACSLSAFEAEREPVANDSKLHNVDDSMCCGLFNVN